MICHNLIPKSDAVWKRYQGRRPFSPQKMRFIKDYLGQLLDASIIEPTTQAEQTSGVTLAPKPEGKYRFCNGFVWLNGQLKKDIWELPNLEAILLVLAGHL